MTNHKKYYEKKRILCLHKERVCKECGEVYSKMSGGKNLYCSDKCRTIFASRNANAKRKTRKKAAYSYSIGFAEVWAKSNRKCNICNICLEKKDRGSFDSKAPEIDHILPLAQGGAHIFENLQIVCRSCNIKKGAKLSIERIKSLQHLSVEGVDLEEIHKSNLFATTKANTSGVRFVTWDSNQKKWLARVTLKNGERKYLGRYNDLNKASESVKNFVLMQEGLL